MRSNPGWKQTVPAGSDILVKLTDALGVRTLEQGMPTIYFGAGGFGAAGLSSFDVGQFVLDSGPYMVEAWGDENDAGELRLLTSAPATVRGEFVDVALG